MDKPTQQELLQGGASIFKDRIENREYFLAKEREYIDVQGRFIEQDEDGNKYMGDEFHSYGNALAKRIKMDFQVCDFFLDSIPRKHRHEALMLYCGTYRPSEQRAIQTSLLYNITKLMYNEVGLHNKLIKKGETFDYDQNIVSLSLFHWRQKN